MKVIGIYNAGKLALEGFSEAMAQKLTPLGITVVIVEPGPFYTNFANKKLPEAKAFIEDYALTAGALRLKLKSVHGKQEGNPKKAALAIIKHVTKTYPSLSLPLGKIPAVTIQTKINQLQADLDDNRKVSSQVIYAD